MDAPGYFPLAAPPTQSQTLQAELDALQGRQRALWLDIEDGLAKARDILEPRLPPILAGQGRV